MGGVFIAQLGALYAYKWLTLAFSVAALSYGFWSAYRTPRCADGSCARSVNRRLTRAVLWTCSGLVAVAFLFPFVAPLFLRY
ncbi:MAG: hypothetical protein AcusKO_43250 [Acuticoccus sp.]